MNGAKQRLKDAIALLQQFDLPLTRRAYHLEGLRAEVWRGLAMLSDKQRRVFCGNVEPEVWRDLGPDLKGDANERVKGRQGVCQDASGPDPGAASAT